MKKIFIYYSLSGNGDIVSDYLRKKGYDIRKVIPKKSLPNNMIMRILTGGFLAGINYKAELVNFNHDISMYDEVVIGSPIWNGKLATPINTVLEQIDVVGKRLTFVLYSGGGRAPKCQKMLSERYSNAKIIHLKEPSKNKDSLISELKSF